MNKTRFTIRPILLVIVLTQVAYGYTITYKEKLIGMIHITKIIENITFIEINDRNVNTEIINKGNEVYPYSFLCSQLVKIEEDYGKNIPFNCKESTISNLTQIGVSVFNWEASEDLIGDQDNQYAINGMVQDAIIQEGNFYRMDLSHRNITVEKDLVEIEVNCRRTNIQSTLVKTYWLCGHVMAKNNLFYPEIRVILNIQKKKLETLVTVGAGKKVIEFGKQISPESSSYSEFLHKLEVYKKQ